MTFGDKLAAARTRNDSLLTVGLDPDPAKLPIADVAAFCREIIDATADLVCCYKPNVAFFEQLGVDGWRILAEVCRAVPADIPVLLDAKRGDMGNTAEAYARAVFDVIGADAVTVSPYLGTDSVEPFLRDPARTAFVLCHTSNPGSTDFQELMVQGGQPLYEVVAQRCRDWNALGNVGLVVGATYPAELARVRAICPDQPILVPGVGSQQGDLAGAVAVGGPLLIAVSRQVLYAGSGTGFADAARSAAIELRDAIRAAA